jgi:hypothetical protein
LTNGLEKQVYIYSLDTSAFYNKKEHEIHKKLFKVRLHKDKIKNDDDISKEQKKMTQKMISRLKGKLQNSFDNFTNVRNLRVDALKESNVISIFDSVLTRTLNISANELSTDIIVVRAFHYKVLESLIEKGFKCNGEKYIYFSSSAGQIRNKKGVFIKQSSWDKYHLTLTCGLSVEDINNKGGINLNKYQSYLALINSATAEWNDFDINKAIVVDDLETNVHGMVDYIDRDTYEITRKEMSIPIEHSDGFGMISSRKSKKAFMVRLPWVKGMLAPVDFHKFARNNNAYIIKDIYGKEWHVENDDIQVIFTKSQFKLWKYYKDWQEYKDKFIKHNCKASKLNEEDTKNGASFNYQMLQSLTDISEKELSNLCESTISDIVKIGSDKEVMLRILGATDNNPRKNHFQNALSMYPELLNDEYSKKVIKDKKKSLVKDAKSGKLNINGKYTYIIPDVYAFMEFLFLGIKEPRGLLSNGDVFCNLYDEGAVDVLRSPHLYREHGIRNNVSDENMKEWYITNGIYTSIHDNLSRLLQYDNDGDKALVVQDDTLIEVAQRNMKNDDIVPLYYEMAKAGAEEISSKSIYNSLILAYKANIGEISNNITKIWNSDNVDLNVIKWLCMNGNFEIDYAKTLFKPTPPAHIQEIISKYIKNKVPKFFIYAKDKELDRVEPVNNSTVNRLEKIIPDKRINFNKIAGKFDYKMLMKNKRVNIDQEIVDTYVKLDRSKKWMIKNDDLKSYNKLYIFKIIKDELLKVNGDVDYVTDVLIKYCYLKRKNNAKGKTTLWESFGDIILLNLKHNIEGTMQCEGCGIRVEKSNSRKYCDGCSKKAIKEQVRKNMVEYRMRKRAL